MRKPGSTQNTPIHIMVPYSLNFQGLKFRGIINLAVLWINVSWIAEVQY